MNQESLIRMATRHYKSIVGSPFQSGLLSLLCCYLGNLLESLRDSSLTQEELIETTYDLEAIEAGLRHFHISFPVNETLFIPTTLPENQVKRLKDVFTKTKQLKRHLHLAKSAAA